MQANGKKITLPNWIHWDILISLRFQQGSSSHKIGLISNSRESYHFPQASEINYHTWAPLTNYSQACCRRINWVSCNSHTFYNCVVIAYFPRWFHSERGINFPPTFLRFHDYPLLRKITNCLVWDQDIVNMPQYTATAVAVKCGAPSSEIGNGCWWYD